RPSEPEADAGDPAMLAGFMACGFDEIGGVAETARPDVANVGREARAEFVAQTQAETGVTQALAEAVVFVVAAVEVGFQLRLQDEAVREQDFVFAFHASSQAAGGADVAGGFELELVRRQALHADRRPVARRAAAARIVAQADRAVPPWSGGV